MSELKNCPLCESLFKQCKICKLVQIDDEDCCKIFRDMYDGKITPQEAITEIAKKYGIEKAKKIVEKLEQVLKGEEEV